MSAPGPAQVVYARVRNFFLRPLGNFFHFIGAALLRAVEDDGERYEIIVVSSVTITARSDG